MTHLENDPVHIIARNLCSVGQLGGLEFRARQELVADDLVELEVLKVTRLVHLVTRPVASSTNSRTFTSDSSPRMTMSRG